MEPKWKEGRDLRWSGICFGGLTESEYGYSNMSNKVYILKWKLCQWFSAK